MADRVCFPGGCEAVVWPGCVPYKVAIRHEDGSDSFSDDVILMWDFRSVITGSPTGTESQGLASSMDCHTESMDYSSVLKLDSSDSPFVAIATDDIPNERTLNYPDMCRQAWENNFVGVTVALGITRKIHKTCPTVDRSVDTDQTSTTPLTTEDYRYHTPRNQTSTTFVHMTTHMQYDDNPDHVAAAKRPLPALPPPYWEIRHKAAALPHLYTEIPDHIAAAQRPLPTLPLTPTDNTIPTVPRSTGYNKFNTLPLTHHSNSDRDSHDRAELHRSLPSLHHSLGAPDCDSDSPDDDTVRFYAAAAEPPPLLTATRAQGNPSLRTYQDSSVGIFTSEPPPLPTATRTQGNPRIYQDSSIGIFHNHQFGASRRHVLYNAHGLPRYNSPYGAIDTYCPEGMLGEGALSGVTWRRSLPVRPYVNWSRQISRENPEEEGCPEIFIPPNTYWPWEIPGEVTRNTPRRASLPLTLPNTYWPWEIPREEP
ncbi:hypothetical protein Bbelb_326160 [Branchiostoma belcheri]|nr:hypothetical protein Bbelb_326160 [Branchiostoma belcheri]